MEPNMKALQARMRITSRACYNSNLGMSPFTMGRSYRPDMKHDEANTLTQMDRMQIQHFQKQLKGDSIYEHLMNELKEIQVEKDLTNEQMGT